MPFQAYYLTPSGELRRGLAGPEVKAALSSGEGLLWVDVERTNEEDGEFLAQTFGFHHLAIEDCVSVRIRPPKIDDFGDYIFIIVHGINYAVESDVVDTAEMEMFLGPNFVVSNHNFPLSGVERVTRLVEEGAQPMRRGADLLAHTLMDYLVDDVLPAIDQMGERADSIEEEVIHKPQQATLERILKLKRSTLRLHRVLAPQREVVNRISRGEFRLVRPETQIYYRDIFDHLMRLEDLNHSLQERADNAVDTYLSSMASRQNESIKTLSTVAIIFLPLTLLVGVYGMNFDNMPELHWRWAYFAVVGFVGIAVATVVGAVWGRKLARWLVSAVKLPGGGA